MPVALPTMLNFAQPDVDHDKLHNGLGAYVIQLKRYMIEGGVMSPGYYLSTIM